MSARRAVWGWRGLWGPRTYRSYSTTVPELQSGSSKEATQRVIVLWDLDNLQPQRLSRYDTAMAIRTVASQFGEVKRFYAFANARTLRPLAWVALQQEEVLHRKRLKKLHDLKTSEVLTPLTCDICGWRAGSGSVAAVKLRKHVSQLHSVKEQRKKLLAMQHTEAGREGEDSGLKTELARANVLVEMSSNKKQAADKLLQERFWKEAATVDCVLVVSADSDMSTVLDEAEHMGLKTAVITTKNAGFLRAKAHHSIAWEPLWTGPEVAQRKHNPLLSADDGR